MANEVGEVRTSRHEAIRLVLKAPDCYAPHNVSYYELFLLALSSAGAAKTFGPPGSIGEFLDRRRLVSIFIRR